MIKYRLRIWAGKEVEVDDKTFGTVWEAEAKAKTYFAQSPDATRYEVTERDTGEVKAKGEKSKGTLGKDTPRRFGPQQ